MKTACDHIRSTVFKNPVTFLESYWFLVLFAMKTFLIYYFNSCLTTLDNFWIPSYYLPELAIFLCGFSIIWLIEHIPKIVILRRILSVLLLIILNSVTIVINCLILMSIYKVGNFTVHTYTNFRICY